MLGDQGAAGVPCPRRPTPDGPRGPPERSQPSAPWSLGRVLDKIERKQAMTSVPTKPLPPKTLPVSKPTGSLDYLNETPSP